jgi:hypothetical protein
MAGEIIYSVFVSSTYEDLREERAEVQKALLKLRCMGGYDLSSLRAGLMTWKITAS